MKTKTALVVLGFLFVSLSAAAKSKSKLSTDVNFEDKLVGGKYQHSNEAITTVEDDKLIDDLIGVRKNFSDRKKRSKELF